MNVVNVNFKFLKNFGNLSYELRVVIIYLRVLNPLEHIEDKMKSSFQSLFYWNSLS